MRDQILGMKQNAESKGELNLLKHKQQNKKLKVCKELPVVSALFRLHKEDKKTSEVMEAVRQPHLAQWNFYAEIR